MNKIYRKIYVSIKWYFSRMNAAYTQKEKYRDLLGYSDFE